jgi:hypothetical protein
LNRYPTIIIANLNIYVFWPHFPTHEIHIRRPTLLCTHTRARAQTLFVLAILWRHRIRYAFDKFLWTGKVDEGVAKTISSNLSQLQGAKVPHGAIVNCARNVSAARVVSSPHFSMFHCYDIGK